MEFGAKSQEEVAVWMRRIRNGAQYGQVFGGGLDQHLDLAGRRGQLPFVVEQCIYLLRDKALDLEGVLRVGGSKKRMEQYKLAFNILGDAQLQNESDLHTVAGLLKLYLRELPQPLIPPHLYPRMLKAVAGAGGADAAGEEQGDEQVEARAGGGEGQLLNSSQLAEVVELVKAMPNSNKLLLSQLLQLGAEIAMRHKTNKMPALNVATVLAPNILRPSSDEGSGGGGTHSPRRRRTHRKNMRRSFLRIL